MHERPVVEKIFNALKEEIEKSGSDRLIGVHIRLGELGDIKPEPLRMYLEEMSRGTALEGAILKVEEVGPGTRCMECHADITDESPLAVCPECLGCTFERLTGHELEIVSIEVE